MGYTESQPPPAFAGFVERVWANRHQHAGTHVLPDGCMDLLHMDGRLVVAGPDTSAAHVTPRDHSVLGLRFRPGALPRLLGVPADALVDSRVPLSELRPDVPHTPDLLAVTAALAERRSASQTTPWPLPTLHHVTARFDAGARVADVADEVGWSARTLQRHCVAVYGYGAATLRRVLRFRRAHALLRAGLPAAAVAARAGYADQPHLHREFRDFGARVSAANEAAT